MIEYYSEKPCKHKTGEQEIFMENKNIYSDIFAIVSENMRSAGAEFEESEECYMLRCSSEPSGVDIAKLSEQTDNRKFLENAYSQLLKRNADVNTINAWESRIDLPYREFQKLVTGSIINSAEFTNTHVRVRNNFYTENKPYRSVALSGVSTAIPEKLVRMYRRMPAPLKKTVKKIMGMG